MEVDRVWCGAAFQTLLWDRFVLLLGLWIASCMNTSWKIQRLWARAKVGRAFVFQQDNDPKHTSGHIKNWFQRRRVDLLDWPSQSPDLNPIEHLWEELEHRVQGVRASNANQKFDLLEAAWKDIAMSVIHKLLDSMSRQCQAVIDANGYATRY
uniref:DDE_3 domain-containing protein n=1 Tax=Caenorhabditis japonica TaxID=281687 RepID=A0A8R1IRV4_CAEJA